MALYFAYGSNLDPAQMTRRCPSARFVCCARLMGHRLTFPRGSESWGGGVAGIDPCRDGTCVEGVVYELSDGDLATLDGFEGTAEGHYLRRRVGVMTDGGISDVWTYYANADPAGSLPPSRRYLDAIVRGARRHGLSADYIVNLERIATGDIR